MRDMNIISKAFQWTSVLFRFVPKLYNHISTNQKLPGPRGYPVIGSLLDFMPDCLPQSLCYLKRKYKHACEIKIFQKKLVFLNSTEAIDKVLVQQSDRTSDRPTYFFWDYVFENNGFGFGDYNKRVSSQKIILTKYLNKKVTDSRQSDVHVDIDNLIAAIRNATDENIDAFLKPFLTDHFTRQVGNNFTAVTLTSLLFLYNTLSQSVVG